MAGENYDSYEDVPGDIGPHHAHKGGAPEKNTNAMTHGLYCRDDVLWESLDDEEQKLVGEMSEEITDRYVEKHGEPPGPIDQEIMRNMLIDMVKRRRANEWMIGEDNLDFTKTFRHETYSTILSDYHDEMEKLGLSLDPEAEKNEAQANFFEKQREIAEESEEDEE